mmetsp:Transcript_26823/g.46554  ORF Transcript_26823/g.46554 Transcript_26823/m.46554 type:complete len:164 (-) Transcript_26823:75-566(-)
MPTNGKIEIAPGVEFTVIAREWRCKWPNEEDDDMEGLKACQAVLDKYKDELMGIVSDWNSANLRTKDVLNDKLGPDKKSIQRIISNESSSFKVIVKLPAAEYTEWAKKDHAPESKFLEELRKIDGVTEVETQTYTLETVNLMGNIHVPKANKGCMADEIPQPA